MRTKAILIDGSAGEGGGQVLRTALSLSLVTGRPFRIDRIRGRRAKPGLLRQHLAAVRAAQWLGSARVEGVALGSPRLVFEPQVLTARDHRIDIGSAGSATLVAQTLIPALLLATAPARITIVGGTHNPLAPPFELLERVFVPALRRMGATVSVELRRAGYFPRGGGELILVTEPAVSLAPLELLSRGELVSATAEARIAHLPRNIAERELRTIADARVVPRMEGRVVEDEWSLGPGNALLLTLAFEEVTELFTGFGQRGVPAELVAQRAADEAARYLAADVAVGTHLADQLLIPLALAGGGAFTTLAPTEHTTTNAALIERFLPVRFAVEHEHGERWRIAARAPSSLPARS